MTFSELGLAAPLLRALTDEGYSVPTPIQAQAIPALIGGADILGIAQTGTGKTAAFALPLLHRIANDPRPAPRRGARVLVLSPTRELAAQIGESFRTYGRHLGVSVAVVFGGVSHKPQIDALTKGVDILVATPGRLIDHLDSRVVTLEAVEAFVLDEADQMLDLGFVRPIRRIVSKMRARRQNLFFSATMPQEIASLAAELLNDPVKIQVTPVATTAERVSQRVIHIEANKKRPLLVELFKDTAMQRTLVFTRTKRGADRVARYLETSGIPAVAIHGNKSQRQREIALEAFKKAKISVLVATDIAARGIDIDNVSHVVNFELPEVAEAYVHRIGRTARAGAEGQAISLCAAEERDLLRAIERLTRQSILADDRRNDASIAVEVVQRSPSGGRSDERRHARGGSGERRPGGGRNASRDRANGEARAPRADRAGEGSRDERTGQSRSQEKRGGGSENRDTREARESRGGRGGRDNRNFGRAGDAGAPVQRRGDSGPRGEPRDTSGERRRSFDGEAVAHVFNGKGSGKGRGDGASRRDGGATSGAANHGHSGKWRDGKPRSDNANNQAGRRDGDQAGGGRKRHGKDDGAGHGGAHSAGPRHRDRAADGGRPGGKPPQKRGDGKPGGRPGGAGRRLVTA